MVMQIVEFHSVFKDLLTVFSDKKLLHFTDLDYCESLDNPLLENWVTSEQRISFAGYEGDKFVGFTSAHLVTKHLTASITIVILETFQQQGFAKKMLQALLTRLFSQGIVRVEAQICTENETSVHLFESLGFEREGILHKNFLINGILYDSYMYAKIYRGIL